jgi:hypothetical protein
MGEKAHFAGNYKKHIPAVLLFMLFSRLSFIIFLCGSENNLHSKCLVNICFCEWIHGTGGGSTQLAIRQTIFFTSFYCIYVAGLQLVYNML